RQIFENLISYLKKRADEGVNLAVLTRHYLGLFQGMAGARRWRQDLSGKSVLTVDEIYQSGDRVLSQNGQ
ncbi:hypothetical protein, partial [Stenotrophomonas maltophilia]